MAKRGKLTQTEKYAIQGMYYDDYTIEDIASELNRTEEIIATYLEDEVKSSDEQVEEPTKTESPKPKKKPNVTRVVNNKTKGGNSGVAVMTQAGSERGDYNSNSVFVDKKRKQVRSGRVSNGNVYSLEDGRVLEKGEPIPDRNVRRR